MMPYVYYVHDHITDQTVYITEDLDDAREWIDSHAGLGDYEISTSTIAYTCLILL